MIASGVAAEISSLIVASRTSPARWVRRRVGRNAEALLPLLASVWLRMIMEQGRLPHLRSHETLADLVAQNRLFGLISRW